MIHNVPGKRITDWFVAQVALTPEAIAVSSVAGDLTYRCLHDQAMSLVCHVRGVQLTYARCIAVIAERSADFVVAVLTASLSGATFVILDSAYPDARLEQLISICRPGLILAAGGAGLVDRCRSITRDTGVPVLDVLSGELSLNTQSLDAGAFGEAISEQIAYFLFTSGSTGTPKCVAVPHAPLIHFIEWHVKRSNVSQSDRFSLLSGLSHDPVLRDIFTPLSVGARLEIPTPDTVFSPGKLRKWFFDRRITIAHLTPWMGRLLNTQSRTAPLLKELRRVFWGGERLTQEVVRYLDEIAPNVLQTNFYGCTETPQAICYFDINPDAADVAIPIGEPVEGFELFIIDQTGAPASPGTVGEICVRSPFLSMGYVLDGKLCALRQSDVYHTGDFGLRDGAGVFCVLGRRDDQVKIRGFRVDLNEVNAGVQSLDGVVWCMSLLFDEPSGQRIESFVQLEANRWNRSALRGALAARLPGYMVPARYHFLSEGPPLLPNGKVDRLALRRLAEQSNAVPAASDRAIY